MKNLLTTLAIFACLILINACNQDDDALPEPDIVDELVAFTGHYLLENIRTTGVHEIYDSVGNQIGLGESTSEFIDTIQISLTTSEDTLLVHSLTEEQLGNDYEVPAILIGNSLDIVYDESTDIRANVIMGKIWLEADSLFMDYHWNKMDTWSTGAYPDYVKTVAKGIRID